MPELPRSGVQERKPPYGTGSSGGREAAAIRNQRKLKACKSEDLPMSRVIRGSRECAPSRARGGL
jgi:hypothetical protein